jgi:hypothetical protein
MGGILSPVLPDKGLTARDGDQVIVLAFTFFSDAIGFMKVLPVAQ